MKEGVIVDISKNKLTVLTPEGDFLEIKNNHTFNKIGDLIYFEPQVLNGVKRTLASGKTTKIKTIIALAASMLLIFSILPYILEESNVYAYVSLDMESSIEFSVSDDMEVLEIEVMDQEGKEMLAALAGWQNKDVAIVVAQILSLLYKDGKIEEENKVVFSTVVLDKDKKLEENLEKKLTEVEVTEGDSLRIETQEATIDDRQKAKEKGVSTATYLSNQTEEETAHQKVKKENTSKTESDENEKPSESKEKPSEKVIEDSKIDQKTNVGDKFKTKEGHKSSTPSKVEKEKNETKSKEKQTVSPTPKGQIKNDSSNVKKKDGSTPNLSQQSQKRIIDNSVRERGDVPPNQHWQSNKKEKKSLKKNDNGSNSRKKYNREESERKKQNTHEMKNSKEQPKLGPVNGKHKDSK